MRNSGFIWVVIAIMALLDIYIFQAVKVVSQHSRFRMLIYTSYWTFSIAAIILLMILPFFNYLNWPKFIRTYMFATIVGVFLGKLLTFLFLLVDDIRRGVTWLVTRLFGEQTVDASQIAQGISRSVFLSWIGIAAGGSLFATLLYGFSNKYKYEVRRVKMVFNKLPSSFKGLKIVHISDIHSGSFTNKKAVEKGVQRILKEKADLILFTGDLVNDRATEMEDYMDVFSKLKAPLGVYSTLGNHDYGDYASWDSAAAKQLNLEKLKDVHKQLGWRLLMNEHVVLQKEKDQIALLGIENWSAKSRFPKYGKMSEAYRGTEKYPFKILMSHDPSHWDAEVRPEYKDVDLMLAGHTHGMQFGVEIPGFRWSPIQYMYKEWAGLYEEGNQRLYVNRGFGFIGYPGRVGILPEITVIELI